jgi:hypothetical protein
LHLVGSVGHLVHFSESEPRNADALFLFSGGPGAVSTKSAPRHMTPNLSFCIWWDLQVK